MIGSEGLVTNAATIAYPDGFNQPPTQGKQGELGVSLGHGDYYTTAYRKNAYLFNRTAVTIPVVTSGVVSVFTLWNPVNSGYLGELLDTEIGTVLATTVVDAVGWYASSGAAALAGTFSTKAVAFGGSSPTYHSARLGEIPNGNVQPFTAYTHSGTPDRIDIIASFGAITDPVILGGGGGGSKEYKGRLLLMPGTAMSVCMSTGAGTTSGLDPSARWSEWPV